MPRKKKLQITPTDSKMVLDELELIERIANAAAGLWYMSETDAEIFPFTGKTAHQVSKEILLEQTGHSSDDLVEERSFTELFDRLTKMHDWFNEPAKLAAEKFGVLRKLLEDNLTDLKVFKIGNIRLDIYIVGLDKDGRLLGVQTKAVET